MNPKTYTVLALGLVLGAILGFFVGHPTSTLSDSPPVCGPADAEECAQKLNSLKNKFQSLSETDIDEYIRLKDMKAKYEKADEIFGKILSIFLLDLGMRVSGDKLNALKETAKIVDETPRPEKTPDALSEDDSDSRRVAPARPTAPARAARPVRPERVTNEDDAKKLLENASLADPVAAWKDAGPLSRRQVRLVNGTFSGQVTYNDPAKKPLDVEIYLDAKIEDSGDLVGELTMKIVSRDGDSTSTSKVGPGSTIKSFRAGPDGAILVETKGGDGVFQLYFMRQLGTFYGNYYEKRGLEEFKKVGIVTLTKR